jgi:hypothetical protein
MAALLSSFLCAHFSTVIHYEFFHRRSRSVYFNLLFLITFEMKILTLFVCLVGAAVRSGVENPVRLGIKNVLIRNSSASGGASVLRAVEKTSFAVYHSLGRFLLGNCVRDARRPHLAAWILFINIITLRSNVCHISSNSERAEEISLGGEVIDLAPAYYMLFEKFQSAPAVSCANVYDEICQAAWEGSSLSCVRSEN